LTHIFLSITIRWIKNIENKEKKKKGISDNTLSLKRKKWGFSAKIAVRRSIWGEVSLFLKSKKITSNAKRKNKLI